MILFKVELFLLTDVIGSLLVFGGGATSLARGSIADEIIGSLGM